MSMPNAGADPSLVVATRQVNGDPMYAGAAETAVFVVVRCGNAGVTCAVAVGPT